MNWLLWNLNLNIKYLFFYLDNNISSKLFRCQNTDSMIPKLRPSLVFQWLLSLNFRNFYQKYRTSSSFKSKIENKRALQIRLLVKQIIDFKISNWVKMEQKKKITDFLTINASYYSTLPNVNLSIFYSLFYPWSQQL